ncbi:DUF11 domain-containing protein [Nonomuraea africana]|uniref:Repeat protein (TIGR01451 family) n=1 Tax=Nonomuraea africana TaxID=46171 RepID=A0ABR9KLH5_9ACTN|nr:DUF11 domain-containing protein [Nonomuraea africana]MBE1562882.1 putative repeat protein (TIGR01451 family) [Nonomuraea africana]
MRLIAAMLMALGLTSLVSEPVEAAPDPARTAFTITVTMDYFERYEVPDSGFDEEGEFYPHVDFGAPGSDITFGDGSPFRHTAFREGGIVSDDHWHPKNLQGGQRWVFAQRVELPAGRADLPVKISILDSDCCGPNGGTDVMDISPANQDVTLDLTYDLVTDTWRSVVDSAGHTDGVQPGRACPDGYLPISQGQACSVGDGDPNYPEVNDGKRARLDLSIDASEHSDADQDSLPDRAERYGVRNADGSMALDLPDLGADPRRRDLFVEVDHTTGTMPSRQVVETVRRAFARAPVDNLDGSKGITLHVDTGGAFDRGAMEGPPEGTCLDDKDNDGDTDIDGADPDCHYRDTGVEAFRANCDDLVDDDRDGRIAALDSDCIVGEDLRGGGWAGAPLANCGRDDAFQNVARNSFAQVRRGLFTYVLYTTSKAGCDMGGQGGGRDHIILYRTDAGALLHELGHSLGLDHGGDTGANCKPNYVSVMNYDMDGGIPRDGGGVIMDFSPAIKDPNGTDRSKAPLGQLREDQLREDIALDPGDGVNQFVFLDGKRVKRTRPLNVGPDWNGSNPAGDGDDGSTPQRVNIDSKDAAGNPGDCANTTDDSLLTGFDDWARVRDNLARWAGRPVSTVPTKEESERIRAAINTADLGLTLTDAPDPAAAGEDLTWTVTVTNHGPNAATGTRVTVELPTGLGVPSTSVPCVTAGATLTCGLNQVRPGDIRRFTITTRLPADLAQRTRSIEATAKVGNLAGPDPAPANNAAAAQTKVIAKADVKIAALTASRPLEVLIGEPGAVTLVTITENAGPSSPVDVDLTTAAVTDPGVTVSPARTDAHRPALAVGSPWQSTHEATLTCTTPGRKTVTLTSTVALSVAGDVDPDPSNNTRSTSFQIDCVVPIAINVRPGGTPNSINLNTDATLAALTTSAGEYGLPLAFDATRIDVTRTLWGLRENLFNLAAPHGASESHAKGHPERSYELDERTSDADLDLVLHFKPNASGLTADSTQACLRGAYLAPDGNRYTFLGCDAVRITP